MKGKRALIALACCAITIELATLAIGSTFASDATAEIPQVEPQIVYIWDEQHIVYDPAMRDENAILPETLAAMDSTERDICLLAQTLWGESRGMSDYENSLVAWCILNRVDCERFPNTVEAVVTAPSQFVGYRASNPIDERLYNIAKDVFIRWQMEKQVVGIIGRTLPQEYLYFYGKNGHNWFRQNYKGAGCCDFTDQYANPYIH